MIVKTLLDMKISTCLLPILVIFLFCFSITSCDTPEDAGGCQLYNSLDNYELVWNDEFEGSTIDDTKWGYDIGNGCEIEAKSCWYEFEEPQYLCGWGNNELEYYTSKSQNSYVSDGKLTIKAIKENQLYLGQYRYTSARLVTKNKGDWKYGRIDVRAKLPTGKGIWPAIWMLPTENVYGPWPCSGEIDIMENIGSESNKYFGTIHYGNEYWVFNSQFEELEYGSFADDFHVFSVLWNESCIQFQLDGNDVGIPNSRSSILPSTYPFDQEFHLLINIAVGGNLPGFPDQTTIFPQTMEVDYVRVYQEKNN